MDTCIVAASSDQIYRRLVKDVVSLGVTATHTTSGPPTTDTLVRALEALRARHPVGEVIALIPETIVGRIQIPDGVTVIPVPEVDVDADHVEGILAIAKGIGIVVMSEGQMVHRRRPTGWRRWLMPWRRVTELQTSVRSAVGVAAQDMVQGIEFRRSSARGDLEMLGAVWQPPKANWPTWGSGK